MTYTERYDILLVKSNCPDHTKIFSKVSPNNKITPRILNKMIAFDFNQTQRVFSQIDSFVGTPQGIVLDTALFQTHLTIRLWWWQFLSKAYISQMQSKLLHDKLDSLLVTVVKLKWPK